MRRFHRANPIALAALLALLASSAVAAPAKPVPPSKPRSARAVATASASSKSAAKGAARPAGPRRLEDVRIEGEVPVPQVLFVTARDQRRVVDFQHHRYLKTSRELAAATPQPAYVALPQNPPPTR